MIQIYSIKLLIAYIWVNFVLLPNQFADIFNDDDYIVILKIKF